MLNLLKSWTKANDGSAAVEFSLLAMPFVLLTLAIIELCLMFAAESLLEGATTQAARQIKTGQLQQSGAPDMEAEFRIELCERLPVLIDCTDVIIEAQTMTNFADFDSMEASFDDDGNFEPAGFDTGGSSDKLLLRVVYYYPAMTPALLPLYQSPNNTRLFMSTIVMQIEPYDFAAEIAAQGGL